MQTNIRCEKCNGSFSSLNSLAVHMSRNKLAIEKGQPSCEVKVENKRIKRDENALISQMSSDDLREAVRQMNTYESLTDKYLESQEENRALQKKVEEMKKITEEHIRLLKRLKPNKPSFSTTLRLNVAGKQGWKCAICISSFTGSDFDIDHKVRWTDSFDNTESNLQALCVSCHRLKTSDENSK